MAIRYEYLQEMIKAITFSLQRIYLTPVHVIADMETKQSSVNRNDFISRQN